MQERTVMLERTLDAAENILDGLAERTGKYDQAIEQRKVAYTALATAKQNYSDAEAEFTFDVTFGGDEEYAKAKNAEARKVLLDYRLVKARQAGGDLAGVWQALNRAQSDYDNADMAFQQAEVEFRGVRAAADLHARYLNAVSMA